MIRAALIDGHWRVVDEFDRRYLPHALPDDGAVMGSFVSSTSTTFTGWDDSTRMDERTAHLLAGVLRQLHAARDERARRSLLICDPCRRKLLSDAK